MNISEKLLQSNAAKRLKEIELQRKRLFLYDENLFDVKQQMPFFRKEDVIQVKAEEPRFDIPNGSIFFDTSTQGLSVFVNDRLERLSVEPDLDRDIRGR